MFKNALVNLYVRIGVVFNARFHMCIECGFPPWKTLWVIKEFFCLKTIGWSLWEQCAFEQHMLSETLSLSQFLFRVFRLSVLAVWSEWCNFFFFLFGLSNFFFFFFLFFPLSSKPFWHVSWVPNCLYSLSFSDSFSVIHLPSASLHLFLYLSQWELMWPLCAVSSLRGRQSSSAPIRTALSGAVSTTGLPTHSLIHACHPPVER